ncbi:MAG: methionine aminotransferase [Flavobacteriaceae bacterium]
MNTFPNKIRTKLPGLAPSIFTTMSILARERGAINLSQGFPNFSPDPRLLELVSKAMNDGYNQYAPLGGIYSLRETISEKILALYGREYHSQSEITVTAGATQAIYTAIAAFVWPGDEVIVLKPAYDCYEPAIEAQGARPVLVQMRSADYSIDWNSVAGAVSQKTKMIIINTPHNPSGRTFSKDDMLALQELLEGTDIILLSDEVYEHIVFDNCDHESVSKYRDLASRSLVCASFGKTFHVTGWKMGYCVAPAELMREFQKIHEFNVFCANHPIQRALAQYLKSPENYTDLGPFFQKKRDLFLSGLEGSRFKFTPSEGTYFQLLDYSEISQENDVEFAKQLTIEKGVASIPISVFNMDQADHQQLRFCFAKKNDTLESATEILRKI